MKKPLKNIPNSIKINYCLAIEVASKHFGVSSKELITLKGRADNSALKRYMIFNLMKLAGAENIEIGGLMNKDHSSVNYGLNEHINLIEQDYIGYRDLYNRIEAEFIERRAFPDDINDENKTPSFYGIIQELSKVENSISRVKSILMDSFIEGKDLDEDLVGKLTEELSKHSS